LSTRALLLSGLLRQLLDITVDGQLGHSPLFLGIDHCFTSFLAGF
jgi:hypothetical protein